MDTIDIGKILHKYRKLSGLSQRDLAELAGVGKTVIYDIEKGKESVKICTLLKILDVLNIKLVLKTPDVQQNNQ